MLERAGPSGCRRLLHRAVDVRSSDRHRRRSRSRGAGRATKKVFAGLEVAGFSHSEVGPVTATPCGDGLAIVDAAKVRRLKADGSLLEEIDGHYVMRETDEGWRFTVAVVCAAGWREAR